jgi:hypothetical protein
MGERINQCRVLARRGSPEGRPLLQKRKDGAASAEIVYADSILKVDHPPKGRATRQPEFMLTFEARHPPGRHISIDSDCIRRKLDQFLSLLR